MEFRLVYRGNLPSQPSDERKSRAPEKHAIRKQFHPQLRELWKTHLALRPYMEPTPYTKSIYAPNAPAETITTVDQIASHYSANGFNFIPLISNARGLACALDILFLRRDAPGQVIVTGGDVDNRIKVLFDALRIPKIFELCDTPTEGENPFFCLMEDDALITDVKITTDRLLSPPLDGEHIHDVHLILHVTTKIFDLRKAWPDFAW